jgi:hypothetical protein
MFIKREIPSWLSLSSAATYTDNGINTNGTISSIPFSISNAEQIKIDVCNIHWESLPTSPSIKLVNGNASIGLVGDKFIYNDGTDDVINEDVGYLDGSQIWSWCRRLSLTDFHLGPKNIAVVIQPYYGYYHVLFNGMPIHSRKLADTVVDDTPVSIDFSGDWHWEVYTGGKSAHISGIDVEVQMNI